MKNKFYLPMIALLATMTFVFSSCDNDDSSDTTKPLIELHEPEEGQALRSETNMEFILKWICRMMSC